MPGFDGTGPLGSGPMTGRGRGYCIIELPENENLPGTVSEVSEMQGTVSPDSSRNETARLRFRVRKMQSALKNLDHRIEILKKNRERGRRS